MARLPCSKRHAVDRDAFKKSFCLHPEKVHLPSRKGVSKMRGASACKIVRALLTIATCSDLPCTVPSQTEEIKHIKGG